MSWLKMTGWWVPSERGAGLAEYVLLLALVAVTMIGAFTPVVSAMTTRLTTIAGLFN